MKEIDLRNLPCPEPVSKTKDELANTKAGASFTAIVDNLAAEKNVTRFAKSQNCKVERLLDGNDFRINITKTAGPTRAAMPTDSAANGESVLFVKNALIGTGNDELGEVLTKAFFNTVADYDNPPKRIFFLNSGVTLTTNGADTVDALKKLEDKGVEIFSCGTCLDYYGLKNDLSVGKIGNMYDLVDNLFKYKIIYL